MSFAVPAKAARLEACWRMRLGDTVNKIRSQQCLVAKDKPKRHAWVAWIGEPRRFSRRCRLIAI